MIEQIYYKHPYCIYVGFWQCVSHSVSIEMFHFHENPIPRVYRTGCVVEDTSRVDMPIWSLLA